MSPSTCIRSKCRQCERGLRPLHTSVTARNVELRVAVKTAEERLVWYLRISKPMQKVLSSTIVQREVNELPTSGDVSAAHGLSQVVWHIVLALFGLAAILPDVFNSMRKFKSVHASIAG